MRKNEPIQGQFEMFYQNIKILRESVGFSKKEMAKILGIGVASLSKLEQGVLPPRAEVSIIFELSQHFNIQPHKLFLPL